jgi:effector-binding domain-containing protein
MEVKKIIIIAGLIILIIVFSLVPFNNKQKVVIKSSLYDVAKQINDLNNWRKWNADLKKDSIKISGSFNSDQSAAITSTYSYTLHHLNPLAVSLTRNNNGSSTSSLIEMASVTDTTTAVVWGEKITIFELIKRNTITHYSRQINLNNLKKLMEDVNYKYGFFIKLIPVKDTLILTAKMKLIDNTSTHIVTYLYNLLQAFILQHNISYEKKYFYTTVLSNNEIAVGIPVYKQVRDSAYIKCLQLPGNGRLVEGNYSGKISEKQVIYNAINNFILDNHLKQVAQPLEQYNVADTIPQPDYNINIKIYYPVF